ncbi:MAG: hypothetical protein ACUVX8_18485, partial [Candidatus Zipacnadales bacterium]
LWGLVFLLGSEGKVSFLLAGVAMVVIGIGVSIFTLRKLGQAVSASPETIDERMLKLAEMSGGEVTAAEASEALQIALSAAEASLERLVSQGAAHHKVREGNLYYTFPDIISIRKIKRCTCCGTEYPLREPSPKCSSCGGTLDIVDVKN